LSRGKTKPREDDGRFRKWSPRPEEVRKETFDLSHSGSDQRKRRKGGAKEDRGKVLSIGTEAGETKRGNQKMLTLNDKGYKKNSAAGSRGLKNNRVKDREARYTIPGSHCGGALLREKGNEEGGDKGCQPPLTKTLKGNVSRAAALGKKGKIEEVQDCWVKGR